MPPPTRFGSPESLASQAFGAAQAKFVTPPALVIQPCCQWISSFFRRGQNNEDDDAQQLVQNLQPERIESVSVKQTGGFSQDTFEERAWPITAKGCFGFGLITCCTAIYVCGREYSTIGHMFGTRYNVGITNGMKSVISDVGDGEITSAKVFFSALHEQIIGKDGHSMNVLSDDQRTLQNRLSNDLGDAHIQCYVYDAREANVFISARGEIKLYVDKIVAAT